MKKDSDLGKTTVSMEHDRTLDGDSLSATNRWGNTFGIGRKGNFDQTQWTLVSNACDDDGSISTGALAELCRRYWYPLYAWLRRSGRNRDDSQDLTQSFFEQLLEKKWIADVDRDKGKLRTFLLTALKRHAAGEWKKEHAVKRGGDLPHLELGYDDGEERYLETAAEDEAPDKHFEKQWAITLLGRVTDALRADFIQRGMEKRYEILKDALQWNGHSARYADLGKRLGLSENAVKQAVSRMRRQYRTLLTRELQSTLETEDAATIEEELGHLASAFRM